MGDNTAIKAVADVAVNNKLSLFLYQVTKNVHLKNENDSIDNIKKLSYPPLFLSLFYLITPNNDLKVEHLYWNGVQVFHENPKIIWKMKNWG